MVQLPADTISNQAAQIEKENYRGKRSCKNSRTGKEPTTQGLVSELIRHVLLHFSFLVFAEDQKKSFILNSNGVKMSVCPVHIIPLLG